MQSAHDAKVRALLKANEQLRKDLKRVQRENKDNVRVKTIQKLRAELQRSEAIGGVLRQYYIGNNGMDRYNELIERTLKEPKRARPPPAEVLQQEVDKLKVKVKSLQLKLKRARAEPVEQQQQQEQPPAQQQQQRHQQTQGVDAKRREDEVAEELEVLRTRVVARDKVVAALERTVEELRGELRAMDALRNDNERLQERADDTAAELERTRKQLLATVQENEGFYQEIRSLQARVAREARGSDTRQLEQEVRVLRAEKEALLKGKRQ